MVIKCFYCAVKLIPYGNEPRTRDHVYPKSRLSHRLRRFSKDINIVHSCVKCNQAKADNLPDLKLRKMLCQRVDAYIDGLKDFRKLVSGEND